MKYAIVNFHPEILFDLSDDFLSKISAIYTDDKNKIGRSYDGIPIDDIKNISHDTFCFIADDMLYSFFRKKLVNLGFIEDKDFIKLSSWYGDNNMPSPYKFRNWELNEEFIDYENPALNIRSAVAVSYIPNNIKSFLDLGAGSEIMKLNIPPYVSYTPVDHVKRTKNTVICDFNKKEFVDDKFDVVMAIGILTYVNDPIWFLEMCMKSCNKRVILSYEPTELKRPDYQRRKLGFKNNLSVGNIVSIFCENGFTFVDETILNYDVILTFDRKDDDFEEKI